MTNLRDLNILGDGGIFSSGSNNEAAVTDDGEVITSDTERERNVAVRYFESGINSTRWRGFIDLDGTTDYPHSETRRLDLTSLHIAVSGSNAQGSIQVGLIRRINSTDADIDTDMTLRFNRSTLDGFLRRDLSFAPSQFKLEIQNGEPVHYLTNQMQETVTDVNTATTLTAPANFTPDVGDLVLKLTNSQGTYDVGVTAFYHGEA